MAEGVCSRTRAKAVIVALIVLSVVAASIAVIVYFSTRNDGSSKGNAFLVPSQKLERLSW